MSLYCVSMEAFHFPQTCKPLGAHFQVLIPRVISAQDFWTYLVLWYYYFIYVFMINISMTPLWTLFPGYNQKEVQEFQRRVIPLVALKSSDWMVSWQSGDDIWGIPMCQRSSTKESGKESSASRKHFLEHRKGTQGCVVRIHITVNS